MSSPTIGPPEPTTASHRRSRPRRIVLTAVLVLLLAGTATLLALPLGQDPPPHDHPPSHGSAEMADRATRVMPFDLATTTHAFTTTPDGGIQQVTADDPDDTANITAIRDHLAREAAAFAAGNYRDPATIHGADMPGLDELETGAPQVQVTYTEVPAGARITFRSTDPSLVAAVHAWFARQNSDHAMPGMGS